jgi:hypothetical protein
MLEVRRLLALTVPQYNSNPGSSQTLYLDFDGSPAFAWNNGTPYLARGGGSEFNPQPIKAFSVDSDYNNYNGTELTHIFNIFSWVSEKFSPFTINVTTVDPGFVEDGRTMTCIISGSWKDWLGGNPAGGVSDIDGFHDGGENTCFAFSQDLVNNGTVGGALDSFLGETIAHEAAHEVGLRHQRWPGGEYYKGDSTRAPIMGASSNNTVARGIWWLTNNWAGQNSPDPVQDDLASLTGQSDQLHFAADEPTRSLLFNNAGTLYITPGVIGNDSDIDRFTFSATGARAKFTINNAALGGMLAPTAALYVNNTNAVVPATLTLTNTSAVIEATALSPGVTYRLEITGQGQYGDIGQYLITGSQGTFASYDPAARMVQITGFAGNNEVRFETNIPGDQLIVRNSVNGGPNSTQIFTLSAVDYVSVDLGAGNDVLNWAGLTKPNGTSILVQSALGGGTNTLKLGAGSSSFMTFNCAAFNIDLTYAGGSTYRIINYGFDNLELYGSPLNDVFNINSQNLYSSIDIFAGDGADRCVMGQELYDQVRPAVMFRGQAGNDTFEFPYQNVSTSQSWDIFTDRVVHHVISSSNQGESRFDSTTERISIAGGDGDDFFQPYELLASTTALLYGNGGNDTFLLGYHDGIQQAGLSFSSAIRGSASCIGGSGDDSLYVDDVDFGSIGNYTVAQTFLTNTFVGNNVYMDTLEHLRFDAKDSGNAATTVLGNRDGSLEIQLVGGNGPGDSLIFDSSGAQFLPYQTGIYATQLQELFGTPESPTVVAVNWQGYEALTVYTANGVNDIHVYETGPQITSQTTVVTGSLADTVTLHPHDAGGTSTFPTWLGVSSGNGTDTLVIDDTVVTVPIAYTIYNPFGAGTQNIGFDGTLVGAGSNVERITILGGSGDDVFSVNEYKTGSSLSIDGGDGNDSVDFGNGNLAANVTNLSSFTFDGDNGTDTLGLNNASSNGNWTYTMFSTLLRAERATPGYQANLSQVGIERAEFSAGPGNDDLLINSELQDELCIFHGGDGNDRFFNGGLNCDSVRGPVQFNGDAGPDNRIILSDILDSTGDVVHIDQNSIGAYAGDSFFAPGGSLSFSDVQRIDLTCGSGLDSVFAQPNAAAVVNVDLGDQSGSFSAAPGDTLYLALASASGYVITPATDSSGTVTSDNFLPLNYSGMEDGPYVDDLAPTVLSSQLVLDGAAQAFVVQFSEDVSGRLGAANLSLFNKTSGEQIPAINVAVTYDAGTNTATFTFPGYANGVLPDGNYDATVLAGLPDFSGNPLSADVPGEFFFLNGDANHDRVVDIRDLYLLASNWKGNGRVFSQGDFNYDGAVDAKDLGILALHWQQLLPDPPLPSKPAALKVPKRTATRVVSVVR